MHFHGTHLPKRKIQKNLLLSILFLATNPCLIAGVYSPDHNPSKNVHIDYTLAILNVTSTLDTYVPEQLFVGTQHFWRQLIFYKNKRLAIFSPQIHNMERLELIQIRGNRVLQNLPDKMFKRCPLLKQIGFTYNGISELPRHFLAGKLPSLIILNLSYNRLRVLPSKFVNSRNAPNLRRLDVSNNFIKLIDCQTFSHLPNLRYSGVSARVRFQFL